MVDETKPNPGATLTGLEAIPASHQGWERDQNTSVIARAFEENQEGVLKAATGHITPVLQWRYTFRTVWTCAELCAQV